MKKNSNRSNLQGNNLHVQHTFLYIFLPLFCTTTMWNFQKLPGFPLHGGNVVRVLVCFSRRSFHPGGSKRFWFSHRRYKISCCSSNKECFLCFFSLALALSLVELGRSVALLSVFLRLSLSLYSKFVGMTINLSLILQTTRTQKHFPFWLFSCVCLIRRRWAIRFLAKLIT